MTCRFASCVALFALLLAPASWAMGPATPWVAFGPDGGDARRIATDPKDHAHLLLGTATGWIYQSRDAGASWSRLAQVGKRDDLVLDSIVVDPRNPQHIVVGAWVVDHHDGGLYFSYDGGASWTNQAEMRGQSVLALAESALDPKIMVAGTLEGVFRSTDGGQRWRRISPPDNQEIHNVQSVAIDPKDPGTIYAGTWHLPWKTTDAGEHWDNITAKQGIIDDSDVFSIIIDPISPQVIYASACSGIYKSLNAGLKFDKIVGIPNTARRTRRLLQDPEHLDTVFAGTTEGLYRSEDAGKTWQRMTGPEVIVNDVSIDLADPKRVLIATDRGGVLASDDGGDTFHPSNSGFSARQVTALRRDSLHPETLYVGVVNDKNWGGVFQSDNGGQSWTQRSEGLEGRDVFSLGQAPDGTIIAGTAHGLFRLDNTSETWTRVAGAPGAPSPQESVQAILTRPPVPVGEDTTAGTPEATATVAPPRKVAAKAKPAVKTTAQHKPVKLTPAQLKARQAAAHRVAGKSTARPDTKSTARPVTKSAARPAPKRTAPAQLALVHHAPVKQQIVQPTNALVFDGSVYAISTSGSTLLAATSVGLLTSPDDGITWAASGPDGSADWRFLAAAKKYVVAASLHEVAASSDGGVIWQQLKLPEGLSQVSAVAIEPQGEVWVGGREGVYVSSNGGATWTIPKGLYLNSINNINYDEATDRITITTRGNSSLVFTVLLPGKQVEFTDTGWNLRFARPMGDHIIAATLYDGIVVQPRKPATPLPPARAVVVAQPPAPVEARRD